MITPVMVMPIIIIIKADVLCILIWMWLAGIIWDSPHIAAAAIKRY